METLYLITNIGNSGTVRIRSKLIGVDSEVEKEFLLVLDTGASHTAINRSVLKICGYNNFTTPKGLKQTAVGLRNFQTCTINELQIGGSFKVADMTVDVVDFGKDSVISGVLGMDFIRQITTIISKEYKKVLLTNKSVPELFSLFNKSNIFS